MNIAKYALLSVVLLTGAAAYADDYNNAAIPADATKADRAVDRVENGAHKGAQKTKNGAHRVGRKIKHGAKKAENKTGQAVENGGKRMERTGDKLQDNAVDNTNVTAPR